MTIAPSINAQIIPIINIIRLQTMYSFNSDETVFSENADFLVLLIIFREISISINIVLINKIADGIFNNMNIKYPFRFMYSVKQIAVDE